MNDSRVADDDKRPGRPSTATDDTHVNKINTLVRSNRRLTIRELAEESDERRPTQKARIVEK